MTLDIKVIRKKHGLTQEQMAEKLGISRQLIIAIEKGQPMSKVVEKILESFDKGEVISNAVNEAQAKYERHSLLSNETPEEKELNDYKALKSIAESNRILAESQMIAAESAKILAESQRQLVNTNADLVTLYRQTAIAGSGLNNPADVQSKLDALLVVLAEVASGTKYHSKQEALAKMGKKIYAGSGS